MRSTRLSQCFKNHFLLFVHNCEQIIKQEQIMLMSCKLQIETLEPFIEQESIYEKECQNRQTLTYYKMSYALRKKIMTNQ